MFWDDFNENYTREQIRKAKEKIKEIKKLGLYITHEQQRELDEAYKTIEELTSKCKHNWVLFKSFVLIRKICDICDKEDETYRYNG